MSQVKINHNAGFFSCCSVKLDMIIYFFNTYMKVPDRVDSSEQFSWYKNPGSNSDITYDYFKHESEVNSATSYVEPVIYHHEDQFAVYKNLNYSALSPLIKKYFSPSRLILDIINNLEDKYRIDYSNTCVLFYRGNDKITEAALPNYYEIIEKAKEVQSKNPGIKFLIQSDETEFIEEMSVLFPNSVYFKDEIRHMKKCNSTVDVVYRSLNNVYSKYYLAITIMMSKCKYVICTSGNCSVWILLYRGNAENVHQNLNNVWV